MLHDGDGALAGRRRALTVAVLSLAMVRGGGFAQSIFSLCHSIWPGDFPRHGSGSGFGHLVYPDVHQHHDYARGEEGRNAGGEDVPSVIIELALRQGAEVLVAVYRDERRRGDESRYEPHDDDDALYAFGSPLQVVLYSLRNGPVAVQAYCAQMNNRRSAEQNIQGQINAAPNFSEIPVAHKFVRQRKRHHQSGDQDVRGGQRHQKQVLWGFQRPARQHRNNHQNIPNHGEQNEKTHKSRNAGYRC